MMKQPSHVGSSDGIAQEFPGGTARPKKPACSNQAIRTRIALGVADDVAAIEKLSATALVALGRKGIRSLDDLADLASDELIEIIGKGVLTRQAADEIIMSARAHWFNGTAKGKLAK